MSVMLIGHDFFFELKKKSKKEKKKESGKFFFSFKLFFSDCETENETLKNILFYL